MVYSWETDTPMGGKKSNFPRKEASLNTISRTLFGHYFEVSEIVYGMFYWLITAIQ